MINELGQLCAAQKLERDKGKGNLDALLSNASPELINELQNDILNLCQRIKTENTICWEMKHGFLVASKSLIVSAKYDVTDEFVTQVFSLALQLLTDAQARVRVADGQLMAALVHKHHLKIDIDTLWKTILNSIEENMEKGEGGSTSVPGSPSLSPSSSTYVLHECAGWNELETSLKCLQLLFDGCDKDVFEAIVGNDGPLLVTVMERACNHSNRFVRETSYYLLASIAHWCTTPQPILPLIKFSHLLAKGFADNWSQVRLSSSVATRTLLLSLEGDTLPCVYPLLMGPMCLNRYYIAEGVRIYSQETWRLIAGDGGTQLVQDYIKYVVQFYLSQTQADNHAVREAACHVIAELSIKLPRDCLLPYVDDLLKALTDCFKDESWPVRDSACIASAQFLCAFPEFGESKLDGLVPLFWCQLEDCIASVREGAAESIAKLFQVYPQILMNKLWQKIIEGLKKAEEQPKDEESSNLSLKCGFSSEPGLFGVSKRIRTTDFDSHTDQTMYSCGSLAPKMGKGGGCSNHSFTRASLPWECTDGCIRLVTKLAKTNANIVLQEAIPLIVVAAKQRHFVQHLNLLETLCRCIPQLAEGLGKRMFKSILEQLLEPIFYCLSSESDLCLAAGQDSLIFLSKFIGPSILRGRIEMTHPEYLILYDSLIVRN